MRKLVIKSVLAFLGFLCITAFDMPFNKKLTGNYIDAFKVIAVAEMHRTGIPASIKLAQGILESDFGRSPLATNAHNHFGIKCGGDWTGATFYLFDDDKDTSGILIESCFRMFDSAEESYMAHSEFLMNPSKKSRYGFLFNLSSTDYEGWANGLKFAGYATDPAYPQKLISVIEKYQLYKYDEEILIQDREQILVNKDKTDTESSDSVEKTKIESSKSQQGGKMKAAKINGLEMVYARGGETIQKIALATGVRVSDLLEYNEEINSMDYVLMPEEIVFLERKKKNIEGEAQFHTIQKGERMYQIAQLYGIRLESLLAKNNLSYDALPLEGQEISLVKQLNKSQTPRFRLVERFDSYVDMGTLR